eukprot:2653281-Rhodomonas_salina.6
MCALHTRFTHASAAEPYKSSGSANETLKITSPMRLTVEWILASCRCATPPRVSRIAGSSRCSASEVTNWLLYVLVNSILLLASSVRGYTENMEPNLYSMVLSRRE